MNNLLYYTFFAPRYGCVIVRDIYTLLFICYKLRIINFKLVEKISSLMFIPLLISIFGEYLSCFYFELFDFGCLKYKLIYEKYEKSIDNNSILKYIRNFTYLYKIVIFYFVTKYICPKFNLYNIVIPLIFIYIYFHLYSLDKSHFGKKLNFNKNYLIAFILVCVIGIYFVISKYYKKINILHSIILYFIYLLLNN